MKITTTEMESVQKTLIFCDLCGKDIFTGRCDVCNRDVCCNCRIQAPYDKDKLTPGRGIGQYCKICDDCEDERINVEIIEKEFIELHTQFKLKKKKARRAWAEASLDTETTQDYLRAQQKSQ